jgi:hypothetical protein
MNEKRIMTNVCTVRFWDYYGSEYNWDMTPWSLLTFRRKVLLLSSVSMIKPSKKLGDRPKQEFLFCLLYPVCTKILTEEACVCSIKTNISGSVQLDRPWWWRRRRSEKFVLTSTLIRLIAEKVLVGSVVVKASDPIVARCLLVLLFVFDKGASKLLRNADGFLPDCTVFHPRLQHPSILLSRGLWKEATTFITEDEFGNVVGMGSKKTVGPCRDRGTKLNSSHVRDVARELRTFRRVKR